MVKKQIIRKKAKTQKTNVKKQKAIWTIGHNLTLWCGLIYMLSDVYGWITLLRSRSWKALLWTFTRTPIAPTNWIFGSIRYIPKVCYRLSLIGVLCSHSVTSWQNWSHLNPTVYDLLSTDNFQNLLIAIVWLFTGSSVFKLVPFIATSYLHLTKKATATEREVTKQNRRLLHCIAYSEIFVLLSLVLDTLLFKGIAGFTLIFYVTIFWLKLNFSPYVQNTALYALNKFDGVIPASRKKQWQSTKDFLINSAREREATREKVRLRL
ncbi:HHR158Wp [Eremothecium sinecaudum]|uniref:HHR158Wp n=1 Tax=Eremothecium sinecaudum TaxID=45286 RepID=A0A0X8HWQ5_9SACH|nr:HHR158Wp [Eremothecium sinecaudum]AMD22927.1 HHR158Wp [Eremothecium sinecaudum]